MPVDPYISALLLSLGAGALYSSLAQGLLLTYRSSGVINFAHGAVALYGAYLYAELRSVGRLVIPPLPNPLALVELVGSVFGADLDLWDIPTFVDLGGPVAVPLAIAIAVAVGGCIGFLTYFLVFRSMRGSPPLAKVVASVGIMLALQAVVVLRFGTTPRSVQKILPSSPVELLGHNVPSDRLYLAAGAVLITAVLAAVYRFTRFGWATEAAAENEKGAILTGISPDRVAIINWTAAAVVAVFMGILFSTVTALSPDNFILFVLPAMGAMLVGGLRSFAWATIAAFGVAALQQLSGPLVSDFAWLPDVGLAESLPLLVIIVAMVARGRSIPTRDSADSERLPPAPVPTHGLRTLLLVGLPALAGAVYLPYDYRAALINSAVGVVIAISLVILVGLVGQISLMQMAIAGMAAVAMTRFGGSLGLPFPVAPVLSAALAAGLSLLAAIPALRIRGAHLAIVTLAGALAFEAMVLHNSSILGMDNSAVDPPSLFGLDFGVRADFPIGAGGIPSPWFGIFAVATAAFACYVFYNLRRGPLGRRFLAIRANERAAAGVGIGVAQTKVAAFALAGFIAGLAGSMWAYQFESVSAPTFATLTSVTALAFVYLAGVSSMSGAIVAGVLTAGGLGTQLIFEDLFHAASYEYLFGGIGLTLAAVAHPQGIAGDLVHLGSHLSARLGARRPATAHVPTEASEHAVV